MADVKLIPLEVLLGNPERAAAQISPDGTRWRTSHRSTAC